MKHFPLQIDWPCSLSDSLKQELLSSATIMSGLSEYSQYSRANEGGVYYVSQGIISVSFTSENTNSMNATLISGNTWMGGGILNSNLLLKATVDEIYPTIIICFPKEKIDRLAATSDEVYKWLYHCTLDVQKCWLKSQLCSLYDRECRIVFSLLDISRRLPSVKGSLVKIDISQKQLSQITGISRPRLNEVLKHLESVGEISLERGSIHLLDIPALAERTHKLDNAYKSLDS